MSQHSGPGNQRSDSPGILDLPVSGHRFRLLATEVHIEERIWHRQLIFAPRPSRWSGASLIDGLPILTRIVSAVSCWCVDGTRSSRGAAADHPDRCLAGQAQFGNLFPAQAAPVVVLFNKAAGAAIRYFRHASFRHLIRITFHRDHWRPRMPSAGGRPRGPDRLCLYLL